VPEQEAVAPETLLYRRVSPKMLQAHGDCLRVTSALFKQKPALSVVIEDTLRALGREPVSILDRYSDQTLIALPASAAFAHDLSVERTPDEDEPAHADVVGNRSGGIARSLLRASEWVVAPSGGCPTPAG
jgi:hypothetical protein